MKTYTLPGVIEALVFDIDNTLYRNDEYYELQTELIVARYAEEKGIEVQAAHAIVANEKNRYKDANQGSATSLGNVMLSLGVPIFVNACWRDELFQPELYLSADERVVSTVAKLASRFKIAALTNNTLRIADRTLKTLGLKNYFSTIVGLDTCFVSKPDTAPFLAAVQRLGSIASNTVSIGDRYEVDIATPLSLGMGGILVENLEDLLELPAVLGIGSD